MEKSIALKCGGGCNTGLMRGRKTLGSNPDGDRRLQQFPLRLCELRFEVRTGGSHTSRIFGHEFQVTRLEQHLSTFSVALLQVRNCPRERLLSLSCTQSG
jgi:hypothetical protein